jgi:hypothetical protein
LLNTKHINTSNPLQYLNTSALPVFWGKWIGEYNNKLAVFCPVSSHNLAEPIINNY